MIASWRVALRLARREALRHRLRSALTAALVGAPVAALVVLATLVASARLSPAEQARRSFGHAGYYVTSGQKQLLPGTDISGVLPEGATATPQITAYGTAAGTDGARRSTQFLGTDPSDPLTAGTIHLDSGARATKSGDVDVSAALARQLSLRTGDVMTIGADSGNPRIQPPQTRVRVVGIAHLPEDRNGTVVIGIPATVTSVAGAGGEQVTLLVGGISTSTYPGNFAKALNTKGFFLQPAIYTGSHRIAASKVSDGVLVVGLALLIAALTAGGAFAVGARKQRRTLALIAVNGGHQPQLSRVVLANGAVLGAVGIVAALPVGLVLSAIGYPILQDHVDRDLPSLRVNVLWLAGACLFGALAALLAASIPARQAARTPVAEGLGASRGATRTPRWVTATGAVLALVGVLVTLLGATGRGLTESERTPLVLLGSGLVQLGGVAICPVLIGAVGRLGRFLPAVSRIALRDSARQRARSGPAIAAVAAAVSGAMALSIFAASIDTRDRHNYRAALPGNAVELEAQQDPNGVSYGLDAAQRARALAGLHVVSEAPVVPVGQIGNSRSALDARALGEYGNLVSDDGTLLTALTGARQPAAETALAQGEVIVPDERLTDHGRVPLARENPDGSTTDLTLPAMVVPWPKGSFQPDAIISTVKAQELGLTPQNPGNWYIRLADSPSRGALAELTSVDEANGTYLSYEQGYTSSWGAPLKALLAVSALFSLLVTASAAALAGADSRADLAALGAVGASPGVRRRLAAAQAGTTAVLGGGLGILIGLVPAYAVVIARSDVLPFTVPWQPFPVFLIGLPVLAALGGLAFTRSRLPRPTRVR